jgi:hypothetical protein
MRLLVVALNDLGSAAHAASSSRPTCGDPAGLEDHPEQEAQVGFVVNHHDLLHLTTSGFEPAGRRKYLADLGLAQRGRVAASCSPSDTAPKQPHPLRTRNPRACLRRLGLELPPRPTGPAEPRPKDQSPSLVPGSGAGWQGAATGGVELSLTVPCGAHPSAGLRNPRPKDRCTAHEIVPPRPASQPVGSEPRPATSDLDQMSASLVLLHIRTFLRESPLPPPRTAEHASRTRVRNQRRIATGVRGLCDHHGRRAV